jgi:uncharacterized protein involved in outer membrane biogenesis
MRWKWIAAGVAGLLVAVIIAAYAILMSYDFNQLKPDIIAQVKAATGRDLSLGGDLKLKVSFCPTLEVEQVALANAPWGSRQQMISAKRLEVQVELIPLIFSEIKLDKLVIIEPDVLIEINKEGRSNLDFAPQAAPAKAYPKTKAAKSAPAASGQASAEKGLSLPPLVFRKLRIENGLVTYLNHQNGEKHKLALQTLKGALPGMDKPVTLDAKGALDEQSFALSGKVGSLSGLAGKAAPWPVEVKLGFRGADLVINGSIKEPMKGKGLNLAIKAKGDDLAKLAPLVGLAGPFSLEGKLSDPKPGVYKVSDLKLKAQGSDMAGWLQADLSGKRPAIAADLQAGNLDLLKFSGGSGQTEPTQKQAAAPSTALGSKAPKKREAQKSSDSKKVFPAAPLPLEALKRVDADIKLAAQKVVHNKLALENIKLQLKLSDGKLVLQPLSGKLSGGELKASLSLATQGKAAKADLEFSLVGCQSGELLAALGEDKIVEAPLEVQAGLAGSGESIAGIMASLGGKLSVLLQQGKIDSRYLEVLGGDLGPVLGNIILPTSKGQSATKLNCLVAGFKIVEGEAKGNVILLNTENMVVLGDGKVNLGTEQLDLVMHPSPKKSLTQKATGGLAGLSLGELTKPFKLTGTLAQPRVGIDEVGAITAIAKTVGGYALLGPLGAAAGALTSSEAGEEAGCAEAEAAARTGGKFEPKAAKGQSQTGDKSAGQAESGEQKFKKDIEEGVKSLKKLFGD